MTNANPFAISTNNIPEVYLEKTAEEDKIIDVITENSTVTQMFMLIGKLGSGKTTELAHIIQRMIEFPNWISIDVTLNENTVSNFYNAFINHPEVKKVCGSIDLNAPRPEMETELDAEAEEWGPAQIVDNALEELEKHGLHILVTMDDVKANEQAQELLLVLHKFVKHKRPIFFLGTILDDDLTTLKHMPRLTFVCRIPKHELEPLDTFTIALKYKQLFGYTKEQSLRIALLINGYPLAFQMFGHSQWEDKDNYMSAETLEVFDVRMAKAAYSTYWAELSVTDKKVVHGVAKTEGNSVKDIRAVLGMDTNKFNQYRKRLVKKGVLEISGYGTLDFALPRFDAFIEMTGMAAALSK